MYVGLTISILMGPMAFASGGLILLSVLRRVDAVVVPSANAILFDTNPLRDDEEVEGRKISEDGVLVCIYNFDGVDPYAAAVERDATYTIAVNDDARTIVLIDTAAAQSTCKD